MVTIVDNSELGRLDAVATAARIHAGELSAHGAVSAAIDRAKALNPSLNAISTETFDSALSIAEVTLLSASESAAWGARVPRRHNIEPN